MAMIIIEKLKFYPTCGVEYTHINDTAHLQCENQTNFFRVYRLNLSKLSVNLAKFCLKKIEFESKLNIKMVSSEFL